MNASTQSFNHGLYGITPEWDDSDRLFAAIEAACSGGMRVLQWLPKSLNQSEYLSLWKPKPFATVITVNFLLMTQLL